MNEEIKVIKDRIADLKAQLAALEAKEQQDSEQISQEFIPWEGGDCPVYERAIVRVKMRDGSLEKGIAMDFWWVNVGRDKDIVAYTILRDPSKEEGWPKYGDVYYSGGERCIWDDTWLDTDLYGEGLVFATKAEDAKYWEGLA